VRQPKRRPLGSDPSHLDSASRPSANVESINAIALARCDREGRCNNVGDGKKFSNRDACLNAIRSKGDNDLTTTACPQGIDTSRLQACLEEVRAERCENPLDTVGRLSACRIDSLCPVVTSTGK
jgi:hypothetical protein